MPPGVGATKLFLSKNPATGYTWGRWFKRECQYEVAEYLAGIFREEYTPEYCLVDRGGPFIAKVLKTLLRYPIELRSACLPSHDALFHDLQPVRHQPSARLSWKLPNVRDWRGGGVRLTSCVPHP